MMELLKAYLNKLIKFSPLIRNLFYFREFLFCNRLSPSNTLDRNVRSHANSGNSDMLNFPNQKPNTIITNQCHVELTNTNQQNFGAVEGASAVPQFKGTNSKDQSGDSYQTSLNETQDMDVPGQNSFHDFSDGAFPIEREDSFTVAMDQFTGQDVEGLNLDDIAKMSQKSKE
jgi:hypothetical protein